MKYSSFIPMKMEQTECSETSEYKIQTPGNYPEESLQQYPLCFKRLVQEKQIFSPSRVRTKEINGEGKLIGSLRNKSGVYMILPTLVSQTINFGVTRIACVFNHYCDTHCIYCIKAICFSLNNYPVYITVRCLLYLSVIKSCLLVLYLFL
jgi:hypothetical protein